MLRLRAQVLACSDSSRRKNDGAAREAVAAALGDEADLPAAGAAVLGHVVRGQHLHFLDRVDVLDADDAPDERVRIAVAPSIVMLFSSERLPLMLKPPLPRSPKPRLLKLPPMTPAFRPTTPIGLRPENDEQLDVLGLDGLAHRDVGLERRVRR